MDCLHACQTVHVELAPQTRAAHCISYKREQCPALAPHYTQKEEPRLIMHDSRPQEHHCSATSWGRGPARTWSCIGEASKSIAWRVWGSNECPRHALHSRAGVGGHAQMSVGTSQEKASWARGDGCLEWASSSNTPKIKAWQEQARAKRGVPGRRCLAKYTHTCTEYQLFQPARVALR